MKKALKPLVAALASTLLASAAQADINMGSAATPVAIAMADVAAESGTVQLAFSPAQLPPGKDTIEGRGRTVLSHGVMNWTKDDHWGFTNETGVMLKVVNGDWKVE